MSKIVWITGASGGIGESLVRKYAQENYIVILSGRNADKLHSIKQGLPQSSKSHILPFDVSLEAEIDQAISTMVSSMGVPDIVILNAGVSQRSLGEETQLQVTKDLMNVNFFSNVSITTKLLPHMKKNKGQIVVMSSLAGKVGAPYRSSYSAAKHALHGYYDSLRAEVHPYGITITLICPGYIKTDISKNAMEGDGHSHGVMDPNTSKGMEPDKLANQIYKKVKKKECEAILGGFEVNAVRIKRYFPSLFNRILRGVKP